MRPHLTAEQRQLALRLKAGGLSLRETGPRAGCSHQGVALVVRSAWRRPVRRDGWVPGPGRLRLADREEITAGLHAGDSFTAIAARLGRAVAAVSREVAASGGRAGYRAWRARQRAREQTRRPTAAELACPRLAARVAGWPGQCKYTAASGEVFAGNGTRVIKTPVRSPRRNAFAERLVDTLRHECPGHFLILGEQHRGRS